MPSPSLSSPRARTRRFFRAAPGLALATLGASGGGTTAGVPAARSLRPPPLSPSLTAAVSIKSRARIAPLSSTARGTGCGAASPPRCCFRRWISAKAALPPFSSRMRAPARTFRRGPSAVRQCSPAGASSRQASQPKTWRSPSSRAALRRSSAEERRGRLEGRERGEGEGKDGGGQCQRELTDHEILAELVCKIGV